MPSTYAPNWKEVPCDNSVGVTIAIINAAIRGRRFIPEPFVDSLTPRWEGADVQLPEAYIGHGYDFIWTFLSDTTLSIVSGALPPGLIISNPTIHVSEITGTPNNTITPGTTYDFTMRATTGSGFGDSGFHITVFADPDEGVGAVGGS